MAAAEHGPRTLLGFDYGRRKIGVAVGQEVSCTAAPVTTLTARDSQPDWDAIAGLIASWHPDALVVGIPRHLDDAEHEITRAARRFGRRLHQRFGLPVFEAEERLSSREARGVAAQQRAAGRRGRIHRGDLDQVAAQIILQDWLQQQEACRD